MKTLQVGLGWFPERKGGLERYYYDLIFYLSKIDVKTQGLVAGSPQVEVNSQGLIQAFAPHEASIIKRWLQIRKAFSQLITQEQYSLIVSHFPLYLFPLLPQLKNYPLVTHFHGPWASESIVESKKSIVTQAKKALEAACYSRSSEFIVLSNSFRDILHQEYNVPLAKINVIPGGVNLEEFKINLSATEARAKLNWSQDRPIIFCVRRLAKRMGLENLIYAIHKVKQDFPDVLLYIAGKGELETTLHQQIKELDLNNHVKLLGFISDEQLPLAYRAANFSVIPSLSFEGFGLVVVESLAAGTPVLGTPVGGIPEILQPFSKDLLFKDSSVDSLAQGIREVLSEERFLPSDRDCQNYVQKNYAWENIALQIKSVYQKALAQA
jgi:glycosyltransferase involved in cell wall biosynthesis